MKRPGSNINPQEIEEEIFEVDSQEDFETVTQKVFNYQYQHNPVYREYCDLLDFHINSYSSSEEIPYLPIEFFKTHQVITGSPSYETVFQSSGTTGMERSAHYLKSLSLYEHSYLKTFKMFYGNPSDYCILALLPGYMENKQSSLISMVQGLISRSSCPESGFYLDNLDELAKNLTRLDQAGKKILLIGVSFALLDMAEMYNLNLKNTIVMETGGMKGRRKELTRQELHDILKPAFGVDTIHSEYGMAELLSQAYSKGDGRFETPPWMKVNIRDAYDPFDVSEPFQEKALQGGINVIDLANLHSCSFIETKDIGKLHSNGSFEVLGRMDYSDIRGCNLMVM
jgi:phenylacetate-coenzyme A ligase PaaK-like adenylate-forming protein